MSNHNNEENNIQEQQGEKRPETFSKNWWKLIGLLIKQTVKDFIKDNGPQWAAAVSYYTLLSAFPLMLAIITIGSFFVPEETMTTMLTEVLGDFLPEGEGEVESIIEGALDARVGVSAFSIPLLLWGGSRVFGVLTRALNIFYDVDEAYGFLKRTAIEMIMLLSIGLLFVAAMASRFILQLVFAELDLNQGFIEPLITNIVPGALLLISFYLIYMYVPRRRVDWKAALSGAVFATLAFSIARPLFWYYIDEFAEYELVYGPIAIAIILVIWTWLVALFVLYGGELVGHIQDMIIEGTSPEEVERRHLARSPFHSDREKAQHGQDDEEFKKLEHFIEERDLPRKRDQKLRQEQNIPKGESLDTRRQRVDKGVQAFSSLTLLAAISSAALLLFNVRRR